MPFTYGLYIKPITFYTIVAIAIIGLIGCTYLVWAKSQGFVKTCPDFSSRDNAQKAFNQDPERYAGLDADNDGIACQRTHYKNH